MNSLLVGSRMSREATSEQSSVREGAGYDEVFGSGHEPDEGFSWSSERETSAQSSDEEVESCGGEDEVVSEGEERDDEDEEGEGRERVTGMKMTVMRRSWRALQEAQEMTVLSFSLKNGRLMTFYQRCRIRFSILYVTVTRFRTTSQSVFLGSSRSAIQGRPRTLACTMPCSRQD